MIQKAKLTYEETFIPLTLVGVIALSLMVGRLVADQRQLILVGLFIIIPVTLIAIRAFNKMVLTIPFVALFMTFSLPTGTQSNVPAVLLLVLLLSGIWIITLIILRQCVFHYTSLNAPLLVFASVCVAAFLWSIVARDPLLIRYDRFWLVQVGALSVMVLSPATALLINNFVHSSKQMWCIAAPFLVLGVIDTFARGLHIALPANTRGLFSLWFIALAYSIVLNQSSVRLVWRILLGTIVIAHLYFVTIEGITWLSGWVPPIVAVLAITLFKSRKAFIILIVVLTVLVASQWTFLYDNIFAHSEQEGDYERLTLLDLSYELLSEHPVLGTGPAGYALYYVTYHPDEARSTHNNYLDIISQTGFIGSVSWLWLVTRGTKDAWRVIRRASPGTNRTLGVAAAGGLIAALVSMLFGDWVIPFAYNQGMEGFRYTIHSWIFLGLIMTIGRQIAQHSLSEE